MTNTKCRIDTVISPDDGHIVDRNIYRKEINILRKIVHQVGFIFIITKVCGSLILSTFNVIRYFREICDDCGKQNAFIKLGSFVAGFVVSFEFVGTV